MTAKRLWSVILLSIQSFRRMPEKVFEEGYDIDSLITKYLGFACRRFYLYRYFTYQLPLDELKATRAKISSELAGCPYVKRFGWYYQAVGKCADREGGS